MQKRPCAACRKMFTPSAHVPEQRFCAGKRCQRERRRRWQKNKRRDDADYRENERRAQRGWAERHPQYWHAWRLKHPEYRERNRRQQRRRDERRRGAVVAKMGRVLAKGDSSTSISSLRSGTYELRPVSEGSGVLAKGDVWKVQIAMLSGS